MSRSYLFIPGNIPSMIQNMDVFESDAVILDLEDSVAFHNKDAARDLVSSYISTFRNKTIDLYIRINPVDHPQFLNDVETTKHLDITGYVLPKATKEACLKLYTLAPDKAIIPIIETPLAVLKAEDIASSQHVTGLLLGAEDLTKELEIERTLQGTELLYARSHIVMVAKAYNIASIDTPYTNKDDEEGLLHDATTAKNLGFSAKASIHPNQVDVINAVFSPSEKDIIEAKRIVEKAAKEEKGAFSLDGKMIDMPIIEKAKKLLEKAKKYNL